jgi:methylmalonyl-CoA/ethylmalonyl-CoA epimerase
MEKLEHIGIAVRNLDEANATFERILGSSCYKVEDVGAEGVRTAFFELGGLKIELLEATDVNSPVARFIDKRGEGIHHIAFQVKNIESSVTYYQEQGFEIVGEPRNGADNKRICFLHPKTTHGVLIELCEDISASSR